MMTAYANGARDCRGHPGPSAQSDVMLEGSVTSVHPLYYRILTVVAGLFCLKTVI